MRATGWRQGQETFCGPGSFLCFHLQVELFTRVNPVTGLNTTSGAASNQCCLEAADVSFTGSGWYERFGPKGVVVQGGVDPDLDREQWPAKQPAKPRLTGSQQGVTRRTSQPTAAHGPREAVFAPALWWLFKDTSPRNGNSRLQKAYIMGARTDPIVQHIHLFALSQHNLVLALHASVMMTRPL